ncbi:MAG TPA: NADPH:quinone oxidoreductase family protein [Sandaracinaceae bacterium LLY-WYZ-13_1]|nr:NADPH:quinone oxidoreductase family protein [Sandaracinaceae bacterium LLY-WYZ-13_1]
MTEAQTKLPAGRRAVVTELGETPLDAVEHHLVVEAQPPPDPSTLAPTDVVLAVTSAAVGWVDLIMTSGQYQHLPSPPYTPGLEFAGEVVWTGDEVRSVVVGDRVIADGFRTGPRSGGEHRRWGGFATYAVMPAEAAVPIPDGLSDDQACSFLGSYETAYHCLVTRGRLREGETVLVHGASGATGLAAVHLAKVLGATVIATGRTPEKLEVVRAQGADHVIRTVDEDGSPKRFREEVKEITGGRKVDVVYDGVGGDVSIESLRCVRFGARFLIVGWASTPFVARGKGRRGAPNANVLPTNLIMMKGLDVLGCPTVITTKRDPGIREERLARLIGWAESGALKPHVSATYGLSEVVEAMEAKWRSRHVGGVVLHPAE